MANDIMTARLILNLDGETKGYVLWNDTESYYEKLRSAYKDISENKKSDYLYFGFFTLCSATLEYSLNFLLTDYCLNHYGHESYKQYAEGYINLSFPKKLLMTPAIISNGEYVFNQETSTYKTLCELITLRNRILHNKEFLKTFESPPLTLKNKQESVKLEIPKEPNYIDALNKTSCIRFGKAIGKFKNLIMDLAIMESLTENEVLIKSPKH